MLFRSTRIAPFVVVLAAALPVASAGAQDLRSPDARAARVDHTGGGPWTDLRSPDVRAVVVAPGPSADLRSPDAQAAGVTTVASVTSSDLRTPDAVDGPTGDRSAVSVDPAVIRVSAPAVDSGFQWDDAGIGAGIIFALLVLSAGGYALMVAHRRSTGGAPLAH